jgi:3-oxosteroid 1-dehydrogenase
MSEQVVFAKVKAARSEPVARRETSRPTDELVFDAVVDVIVVGGGAAGLSSALFAAWQGERVMLLEKAPELGGTTLKAAFLYWIPNNGIMQELGIEDPEDGFLRYCARTSRPEKYDPDSPTLGQTQWEYDSCKAIYASAWPAAQLLHERGALRYVHEPRWEDYHAQLEEASVPTGRTLWPEGINETFTDGGQVAIESMTAAAETAGVDIRVGHRVQRLIVDDDSVVGVVASTVDEASVRIGARKGVVFASGGFTHDQELRENFLSLPAVGGCAARTNEGDFVRIGSAIGAQLRNMQYAWRCPVNLYRVVQRDPDMLGTFSVAGDSMICVNYRGERVLNEKMVYHEFVQQMHRWNSWEGEGCEYPNRILIQLWDEHSQQHSATPNDFMGSAVQPLDQQGDEVLTAATLEELADKLKARFDELQAHTGNIRLAPDFLPTLRNSIARFNGFAETGVDEDYGRGKRPLEHIYGGLVDPDPAKVNPLMYPISDHGPYYATLLAAGTLDTKGGPKTTPNGEVVDDGDQPIPGLYGVGNCVASPSGAAYWAGGGTLGPILAFAYRTADAIHLRSPLALDTHAVPVNA